MTEIGYYIITFFPIAKKRTKVVSVSFEIVAENEEEARTTVEKSWSDIQDQDMYVSAKRVLVGYREDRMRLTGRVVRIPEGKNFGFIKGDADTEYFFHREDFSGHWFDMVKDVAGGHTVKVTFITQESAKGPRAGDIRREGHPNES